MAETKLHLDQAVSPDAWKAYTPTFGGISVGNAVISAKYVQIGKLVVFYGSIIMGNSTTYSGQITMTIPVVGNVGEQAYECRLVDAGTNSYQGIFYGATAGRVDLYGLKTDGTYLAWVASSTTVPFTWAVNDVIRWTIVYEAA